MRLSDKPHARKLESEQCANGTLSRRKIRRPVIIIGCARSGTTMLGRILSQHPDLAIWHELRMIWMHGHAYNDHDELGPNDLTPRISRFIDKKFAGHLAQIGKLRFGDKTPSNCYRIPFIHALYSDCRIINIIRDGRRVVSSLSKISQSKPAPLGRMLRKRLTHTPVWEWPAYLPRFCRNVQSRLSGKPNLRWGPLPAHWHDWEILPRHVRFAEQWRSAIHASTRDGRALPADNYIEIRYEDIIKSPERIIRDVLEFAELTPSEELFTFASTHIDPARANRSRSFLGESEARDVEKRLAPMLHELGYPLAENNE